jgi:hypothetical protein
LVLQLLALFEQAPALKRLQGSSCAVAVWFCWPKKAGLVSILVCVAAALSARLAAGLLLTGEARVGCVLV